MKMKQPLFMIYEKGLFHFKALNSLWKWPRNTSQLAAGIKAA